VVDTDENDPGGCHALAASLPSATPSESTRQQLLDLARAPSLPLDLESYAWDELAPGIQVHMLWEDPARGARAFLAWGRPGARHVRHRHLGDENILVLQGALGDEHGRYRAGDLCRSRAGSVHTEDVLPGEDCICYVFYYGALEPVTG
jgi:anti-sigma factor ChrR (cupin superfamily)